MAGPVGTGQGTGLTEPGSRVTYQRMGLDAVEMVMEVEDAFDIRLEDHEVEKVRTPGHLIDLVMAKVAVVNSSVCLTQRAFNRVRAGLLRYSGLSRQQIFPAAKLATLISKPRRRELILALASDLGTGPLPVLIRPAGMKNSLFGFSVLSGLCAAIVAPSPSLVVSFLILAVTAACVGAIGVFATHTLRTEFAESVRDVAHLSRWVMAHKADLATPLQTAWTRDQIAARVREIVIECLDCEAHYREDALFVEDLGLY
jgi:acyl carrier protein